ncbi:MFS transporter permease [Vibrio chagasii]|nr:MFS transporter permease [Vibrio chagasii]
MNQSDFGKWLHAAFTGASFAYFLTVIDKTALVSASFSLMFATASFALSLILNSVWCMSYYMHEDEEYIAKALKEHWILRRFNALSQWSFIFAVAALVYFVLASSIAPYV